MNKNQPEIKISESSEVKIKIPDTGGIVNAEDVKKEADAKFKDINYILISVVIILLVMVATLMIDSFHINSATYKEYSEKIEAVETTQKINKELLEQNKVNQEMIIELQKQILEINKK